MNIRISIQTNDCDLASEIAVLNADGVGAVATFSGLVRPDDNLTALILEHYPQMTEREIARIVDEAQSRWPLIAVTIIHRIGRLTPGENIVFVGVSASHRSAAFAACEFLMDFLKTKAPFWKQEERGGASTWVEAKTSDDHAAERWHEK
ncbi:MAG TPA: molybdenum cofactor biosynthesis protein MoaE [Rhizomicrobium sp.]|nr:molybdenum cofactor biosynthesis protein MoaE [Rhizomicrobium sp.]